MTTTPAVPPVPLKLYQFFRDHGACVIGEHARVGLALARAFQRYQEMELEGRARFVWDWDQDADTSWMDERELKRFREGRSSMESCRLEVYRDEDTRTGYRDGWSTAASLGGIHLWRDEASRRYRKVVQAELALEYFGEGR